MRRQTLDSENIRHVERNPHLQATTRARIYTNHPDERVRIVEETTCENPQTVLLWHVSRRGRMRPYTGERVGRVSRGELSPVAIDTIGIQLDPLYQII